MMVLGHHYQTRERHHGIKHCELISLKLGSILMDLSDQTPSKMVDILEQSTITPESMVGYGSLSNLKKAL